MTFDEVDIIQYNDQYGNIYPVRDKKDFNEYTLSQTLKVQQGMDIDEVISRQEIYGDGSEDLSYAVAEMNAETLAESDFDVSKLKTIDIPIIENN